MPDETLLGVGSVQAAITKDQSDATAHYTTSASRWKGTASIFKAHDLSEKLEFLQILFSKDGIGEFRLVPERNRNLKFVSLSNVPMSVECADALITVFNSSAALESVHFTPVPRGGGRVKALNGTVLGKSSVRELSIDLSLANRFSV